MLLKFYVYCYCEFKRYSRFAFNVIRNLIVIQGKRFPSLDIIMFFKICVLTLFKFCIFNYKDQYLVNFWFKFESYK